MARSSQIDFLKPRGRWFGRLSVPDGLAGDSVDGLLVELFVELCVPAPDVLADAP